MRKRKLKLVKVAKVEAVACLTYNYEKIPEYRCSECGFGVAEGYVSCPYCGSELDWKFDKPSKEFLELIDKL